MGKRQNDSLLDDGQKRLRTIATEVHTFDTDGDLVLQLT